MINTKNLTLLLLLSGFLTTGVCAQGTKADYERSKKLRRTYSRAYDGRLNQVHWFPGDKGAWYRTKSAGGETEYRRIDLKTGITTLLLDEKKLARAIAKVDKAKKAPALDVLNATLIPGGIRVRLKGDPFLWDVRLPQYGLTKKKLDRQPEWQLPKVNHSQRSKGSSSNSNLLFVNDSKIDIEVFWVNYGGKRKKFADVAPGKSFNIATFAGHVWTVLDKSGVTLGTWRAKEESLWVRVDNKKARPKPSSSDVAIDMPKSSQHVVFEDFDLYLQDSDSGKKHLLSDSGSAESSFGGRVHWSPNRRYALVFKTKHAQRPQVAIVESAPKGQLQPKLHQFGYTKPGDEISRKFPWLIDIRKKTASEIAGSLFDNPYQINRVHWLKDSSAVTFYYNQRGHRVVRLISIDAKTAKAKALVREEPETFVDYAGKTFLRFVNEDKDIIWMSERSGWNHLYRLNSRTGKMRNAITTGEWVVRKVERIDDKGNHVYFWAGGIHPNEDPYHLHYCRVDFDGKNLTILTEGDGTHEITMSPTGKYFIDTWSRVDLAHHRALRRLKDGSKVCDLAASKTAALEKTGWQRPERFVAKGRDGQTDIWGVLFRPSNFDPNKSYPVIEAIYAGPHSAHVPKKFSAFHGPQAMAELGFLVVKMDGMGTSHRSKAFHDVCWKNLGDAGFPDRIAWIKALAKKVPAMDLTRVGIYGGSAGGQNAMRALIAHNDFYHVAVADCGCHDNRMDKIWWNELWMSYPIGPHYSESSNVDQAHRLEGKLLLIVGELDRNVDPASTMQVVDALVKADKDFDLLVIPGAGHGAAGTPYGRRRQQDYLVRHLLHVDPRL